MLAEAVEGEVLVGHQLTLEHGELLPPGRLSPAGKRVLVLLQPNQQVHMEAALVSQHLFDALALPSHWRYKS